MWVRQALVIACLALCVLGQHRPPPGVNPQQYNANQQMQPPPPPHNQQHQQNQHYQQGAPGVPPTQYQQQQQQQQQQHLQQPPQQQQQQQQFQQQQPPQQQQQQQQQQFQQPPQQQQQFQQPPQQQQQPPPQQQQPPPQQHQQPPQQQRQPVQPVQGAHATGAQAAHQHHGGQRINLHNPNLSEERDHMKEHMDVPLDTAGMSEQELQFHYFKMHDADNNNKLDGQELIKSLFHWHDAANHDGKTDAAHPPPEAKLFGDEELQQMIDPILDQDDKNKDGYIDYPEFVQAQRNAAQAQQTNQV